MRKISLKDEMKYKNGEVKNISTAPLTAVVMVSLMKSNSSNIGKVIDQTG